MNKIKHQLQTSAQAGLAAFLLLALLAGSGLQAQVIWDGDVDGNWSTDSGPGNTNWVGDVLPTTTDTVQFNDVISGTQSTTVDVAFINQALRINQTTTTAVNEITLGSTLTLSNNGAMLFNSATAASNTLANADMFVLDLNGNDLVFSGASGNQAQTLMGSYVFDTTGGDILSNWAIGTSGSNSLTFNFGNASGASSIEVSGSGVLARIGQSANLAGTSNNSRPFTINLGTTSNVDVTSGGHLAFIRSMRADSHTFSTNNAGTIDVGAGSI
ncbi:MAG: hypothetical protein HC904_06715 [Blastochloris sp.]|nr:hypothetical protein [Blastochloris sp.]